MSAWFVNEHCENREISVCRSASVCVLLTQLQAKAVLVLLCSLCSPGIVSRTFGNRFQSKPVELKLDPWIPNQSNSMRRTQMLYGKIFVLSSDILRYRTRRAVLFGSHKVTLFLDS